MSNMEHPVAKGPAVCLAAAAKRTNAPETREQVGSAQRYGWSKKPLLGRSEASPWPTRARVDIRKTKFVTQQDPPCVAAGAARCRQTKSALNQHRQIKPAARSVSSAFGIGNIKGNTRTKDSAVFSRPRPRSGERLSPSSSNGPKGITAPFACCKSNSTPPLTYSLGRQPPSRIKAAQKLPADPGQPQVGLSPVIPRDWPPRTIEALGSSFGHARPRLPPAEFAARPGGHPQPSTSPPRLLALNHIGSLTPLAFCKKALLCLGLTRAERNASSYAFRREKVNLCLCLENGFPMPLPKISFLCLCYKRLVLCLCFLSGEFSHA